MYQGPVRLSHFVAHDDEEAAYVISRWDNQGKIGRKHLLCVARARCGLPVTKRHTEKRHTLQKGRPQSLWQVRGSHGGVVCCRSWKRR